MLAIQLKNYLSEIADETNVLIYINRTNETRQLLFADLDVNHDGNIVIDAEYEVPVKIHKEHG